MCHCHQQRNARNKYFGQTISLNPINHHRRTRETNLKDLRNTLFDGCDGRHCCQDTNHSQKLASLIAYARFLAFRDYEGQ